MSEWISVQERLPEESDVVLAYGANAPTWVWRFFPCLPTASVAALNGRSRRSQRPLVVSPACAPRWRLSDE
jgi:hypothetical protein